MADLNDDIEKYLRGELTPAEMHALEKRALRDPFLADALEGTARLGHKDLKADLEELHQMMARRIEKKPGKIVSFWIWPARIAAGLLLLILGTVAVVTLTSRQPSEDDLAVNKTSSPTSEPLGEKDPGSLDSIQKERDNKLLSLAKPAVDPAAPAQRAEAKPEEEAASPAITEEEITSSPESKDDKSKLADEIVPADQTIQASPQPAATAGELKKSETGALSVRRKDKSRESAAGAATERSTQDESVRQRIVRGQVSSKDGSALPGVNVVVKGTNVGTVTDADGNYQIAVERDASLVFSQIGFVSTELPAGQQNNADVQLNEDVTSLSEVVVTGYSEDNASDHQTATYEMAAPSGGRKAFKQYLEKNLRYPSEALRKKVEGRVTIQFMVQENGELSDFKIIKGIGSGCDEEVIRLIQQGPKWTPAKKNNDSLKDIVKVRMKFELPK